MTTPPASAVANTYRSKVAVLNQGIRNANDGLSTLQIKDGALNNISNLLDRLATLASQAASTSSTVDRTKLNTEFKSVIAEIDREANVAGLTVAASFSVFVSNDGAQRHHRRQHRAGGHGASGLAIAAATIDSAVTAAAAVVSIAAAVGKLGTAQGNVGALENRLQFAVGLAQSQSVNTQAAESRIRDANIAEESASMTKFNILTQSGIAALSQANQSSQSVLSLLR